MRCFFLVHMALRVWENCLSELAITGQLKTICATLVNTVVFGDLLRLNQCFKSLFIMFCLDLFYWLTFLSTFSNSSSNFRTVSLFAFSDFLWHLWQVCTLSLFLHLCSSSKQPFTVFFFFFTLLSWLLIRRCHPFDCVQHLSESSSFVIHSVSV